MHPATRTSGHTSRCTSSVALTQEHCQDVRSSSAVRETWKNTRRNSLIPHSLTRHARESVACTVHGHSLRLAEDGMMFDMLQRCVLDKKSGVVKYVKDQVGVPLDKEVKVGKPMDEKWLKAHSGIFHSLVGVAFRDDAEYVEYVQRVHSLRTKYGFMPKE